MRDWLNAFLPASFRGVPFKVDLEEAGGARRLSVSPIAYAETSVIEDMGKDPGRFAVTAYTAGDIADGEAKRLIAALDRKGSGLAVLPMFGPRMVRVTDWSVSRSKWRAGHVAIDVGFIEAGLSAVPFSAGAAAGRLADAMTAIAATAGQAFAEVVSGSSPFRRDAISRAGVAAAGAAASVATLAAPDEMPTPVTDAVAALDDAGANAPSAPEAFAGAVISAWRTIGRHCDADKAFALGLADLSASREDTPVAALERAAIAGAVSVAAVRRTYAARRDARTARQQLAAACDPVLIEVSAAFGADLYGWLSETTGQAALDISRAGANRAPMVRVETGVSLPSTAAAYALYGDANRAGELVDRNGVATPALMPIGFEALAP